MKQILTRTWPVLLLGIILFSSCHTKHARYKARPKALACPTFETDNFKPDGEDRMIIYNASVDLEVKNPDSAINAVKAIAKQYAGYTQEIQPAKVVIRVKSSRLSDALVSLSDVGRVKSKSISGEDVTETYMDLGIRLSNAEKARTRYLELLNKAVTVEEVIKVEKELERLNETIDLLKGKINRLDHLNEYSTISVYLDKKTKPGILGYVAIGAYKGVKWLFVRN